MEELISALNAQHEHELEQVQKGMQAEFNTLNEKLADRDALIERMRLEHEESMRDWEAKLDQARVNAAEAVNLVQQQREELEAQLFSWRHSSFFTSSSHSLTFQVLCCFSSSFLAHHVITEKLLVTVECCLTSCAT